MGVRSAEIKVVKADDRPGREATVKLRRASEVADVDPKRVLHAFIKRILTRD
jgi:hypothetical protein